MGKKRPWSEEIEVLMRQLVVNGHFRMAAHVLKNYFIRSWKVQEELAHKYMQVYFRKYYSKEVERYQKQLARKRGEAYGQDKQVG